MSKYCNRRWDAAGNLEKGRIGGNIHMSISLALPLAE